MRRRIVSALVLLVLALGGATAAADSIVLYSQGFACIDVTRILDLKPGDHTVTLTVPAGLVPESLSVAFDGKIVSQSFHYLPADSLLQGALGKKVEVVAKDGTLYRGTLISTSGGIVVRDGDGTIHMIQDPARLSIAGGLIPLSPYLELHLSTNAGGSIPLGLTYLATGFGWSMSYVGSLSADEKTISLTGWAKLENSSDYDLTGPEIKLVAGDVNQSAFKEARVMPMALPAAPMQVEQAFEYHLYTLPGPISLPAGSSLLLPYGSFSAIPVEKVYTYDGARGSGVEVSLRFNNTEEAGLGVPLPAGNVRLFQARSGGPIFIGADSIGHTPVGAEISLSAGSAFDITGKRTELSNVKLSGSTYRASYRIELRNHKDEPVTVNVLEHPEGRSWKITSSSQPYTQVDSGTIRFVVTVPADGESEVTYTVEYSY